MKPFSSRPLWFRLHWLLGLTAGSVLVVIGLSGATLSFRDELLDAFNPGVRHGVAMPGPPMSPARLVELLTAAQPGTRVTQVVLSSEPGAAARVDLAPPPGKRRGETLWVDPYSGVRKPALRGADFFEWVEDLHRRLLLPRATGEVVTGTLATCLLAMALSGLWLRWPRRPLDWRAWFAIDLRLRGRPFLWRLHAVVGTCALLMYLVSTSTGIYWAFDAVRGTIDGWAGVARPPAPVRAGPGDPPLTPVVLDAAWHAFTDRAGAWRLAQVRIPEHATQPVQIVWLAGDAPHERARNRMTIRGDVVQDERYAAGTIGARALSAVYPLHLGTYFGLAGRIAMTLAALALPVFAATGWMMYAARRRLAQIPRGPSRVRPRGDV